MDEDYPSMTVRDLRRVLGRCDGRAVVALDDSTGERLVVTGVERYRNGAVRLVTRRYDEP